MTDTPAKKKKWDVPIGNDDGTSGTHIWVMAHTSEEAIADALELAPKGWTNVLGKPKDITKQENEEAPNNEVL
jgi:hypothetical protein